MAKDKSTVEDKKAEDTKKVSTSTGSKVTSKTPKKRFGRPANERQIEFAKAIALANNVPEPEHLYDYHISLCGWIWGQGRR